MLNVPGMGKPAFAVRDSSETDTVEDSPLLRLWKVGAHALSDPELLAVLFGRGQEQHPVLELAENLLAAGGGLKALCLKDPHELCAQPGMTARRAAQVSAALELGRRVMRAGEARPILRTPEEIFRYLAPSMCGLQREHFRVLCMNSRNALVADVQVAQGSTTSCPVDPRDVFHAAITHRASAIILAHNHPSGDPMPSVADLELTRQLIQGAALFCIRVLDHIVIGDWAYQSLALRGELLFERTETKWNARGGGR